ncbi:hypothetical protein G9A89_011415 [Geosiphon pyriformis]|nr:hypothetical protein G9A89_011415 [Geosiphon pyriformis]
MPVDLLITPENAPFNNLETNQKSLTSNIPLATIMKDESLAAIFSFEIKELLETSLFSGAALKEKPIMAMYTNVKINGYSIKLILDIDQTTNARIIITDGTTKTLIGEIDNLSIEVNSIIVPVKILVMEATQYQALVGNNWLFKTNTILNWTIQELQFSQNSQHIQVPAMYGHFKALLRDRPLIKLEEEKEKPTWEAYQVSWTDENHNKLPLILS